jgi:hypothetical protein
VQALYRCSEREIVKDIWQAIVYDDKGEMVFACNHQHPAWEYAADCAYLWTIKRVNERGLMPKGLGNLRRRMRL